jgi:hypothetical protein
MLNENRFLGTFRGHSKRPSHGEIVVGYDNDIEIISRTGESKVTSQFSVPGTENKEGEVIKQKIVGLAVDQENNVYVVLYCATTSQNGNVDSHAVLYILDEQCNRVKHKTELNFLPKHKIYLRLAINKNNNIVMASTKTDDQHMYIRSRRHPGQLRCPRLASTKSDDQHMYVCDHTGQLRYKFEYELFILDYMSVSDNNEIMLASYFGNAVQIYTEEGNLKLKIELPAGHVIRGVVFHFVIRKIIVLTGDRDSYFLHSYSETGELETSKFCFNDTEGYPQITSHASGPVAIVRGRNITYI